MLAGISDFARPAEKLSFTQNFALTCTGLIWTRWCLIIKPKNYLYELAVHLPFPSVLLRLSYCANGELGAEDIANIRNSTDFLTIVVSPP